jgi:hypothetical protein
MSIVSIRAALETALAGMTPSVSIAYENAPFTPAIGAPYQRINLLMARPDNAETGANFIELGIFQIRLCYPLQTGPSAAAARAELIRVTFRKAAAFTSGGITVTITDTPEISPGEPEDGRYILIVRIRFRSFIPS